MQRHLLGLAFLAPLAVPAPALEPQAAAAPVDAERSAAWEAWQRSPTRLERTPPEAFPAHLRGPGVPYGLNELDGALVGVGPGYTLRLEGGDFELGERGGEGRLGFELSEIARGEAVLWTRDLGAGALVQDGFEAHAALTPAIDACFRVGADGVEQSFLFRSLPPGRGDLVVRGRLTGGLRAPAAQAGSEGLELRSTDTGGFRVHYGGVLGIDAGGRARDGRLAFDGGVLELRLPARFVDGAAMPLVLDPLVSPMDTPLMTGPAYQPRHPSTAFDETTQRYLTVWQEKGSYGTTSVYGQFQYANGVTVGGLLSLAPLNAGEALPRLANVNASDRFLLVYRSSSLLKMRAIDADSGAATGAVSIGSASGPADHDVGGELLPPYQKALVAWLEPGERPAVRRLVCPPSGAPSIDPAWKQLAGSPNAQDGIRVSSSGGVAGRWLVAWRREAGWANQVVAQTVDYSLLESSTVVPTLGAGMGAPAVSGTGTNFVVAAVADGGVYAASLHTTSSGGLASSSTPKRVDDAPYFPDHVALDYVGGYPVVAWTSWTYSGGTGHGHARGRQLWSSTCNPVAASFVLGNAPDYQWHDELDLCGAQSASAASVPKHALFAGSTIFYDGSGPADLFTSLVKL